MSNPEKGIELEQFQFEGIGEKELQVKIPSGNALG
jgi:hypothetical protein